MPRRPRGGGPPSVRRHDDLQSHGQELRRRATALTMRHRERQQPLGVDPRLVIVFELGATVDPDEFRRSGLRVVDSSDNRLTVAFADDPALAAFHERLNALEAGPPEGQKNEPYAQFFDAIENMRELSPKDRITGELHAELQASDPDDILRLDVECWHPGDADLARAWLSDLASALEAANGRLVDSMVHNQVGLLLARVYVPASRVPGLAELDIIARIDVLPRPVLTVPGLFNFAVDDIPPVHPPQDGAPLVGVIDSGIASGHELIASAVAGAAAVGTGISDEQDEHGHGTMVTSILLHGDVARALARGLPLRPICRVVTARVLDRENQFPAEELWEHDLAEAIKWCADQGATIINLSIGDSRYPFEPPRQMSAAAIVDDLARRLGLVVVVASGNVPPADYLVDIDETSALTYPAALIRSKRARLLDPATSLLALTVGGLTEARAAGGLSGQETVRRIPMGNPGWPAPITRVGPGPGGAPKPELLEQSGTLGLEDGQLVSNDAELGVIGARAGAGRLLSWDVGTSYAAPLVSRVAAAIKARHPGFSAELLRALVVLSTTRVPIGDELDGQEAQRRDGELALAGYGRPSIARAIESTTHRAVLVADDEIPIDGVHVYEVPVPTSFFTSGGHRGIEVSLSYSPRTRVRRLDYMATRMEFHLVRGLTLDKIIQVFTRLEGEDLDDEDIGEGPEEIDVDPGRSAGDDEYVPDRPTVSRLGSRNIALIPPTQTRSRGANQLGRKVFRQKFQADRDTPMYLVIRNVNRWDDPQGGERYGLALSLWRDEHHAEVHTELEHQLEAVVELPVEIEIEV
jgi:hypothetical protein